MSAHSQRLRNDVNFWYRFHEGNIRGQHVFKIYNSLDKSHRPKSNEFIYKTKHPTKLHQNVLIYNKSTRIIHFDIECYLRIFHFTINFEYLQNQLALLFSCAIKKLNKTIQKSNEFGVSFILMHIFHLDFPTPHSNRSRLHIYLSDHQINSVNNFGPHQKPIKKRTNKITRTNPFKRLAVESQ